MENCNFDDDPPSYNKIISNSNSNNNNDEDGINLFARTLYRFDAQFPNELSFKENEIIHLRRYVDDEWIEGDLNGAIGIFPKNFVEIIDNFDSSSNESFIYPNDTFGRVLYDFNAEYDGDLSVKKGDTITLIRRVSSDWIEALNDIGKIGFVPLKFIEQIDDVYQNLSNNTINLPQIKIDLSSQHNQLDQSDNAINESSSSSHNNNKNDIVDVNVEGSSSDKVKKVLRPAPPIPCLSTSSDQFKRQESIRSISSVTSSSSSGSSSTPKVKSEEQRRAEAKRSKQLECVIIELLQTERDYLRDLTICFEAFNNDIETAKEIGMDIKPIIDNLSLVIDVSEKFASLLQENVLHQKVGQCFLQLENEFKNAYTKYCKNHDELQPLWSKYESDTKISSYLHQKLEQLRQQTNCFDIPALLIKPVQRILKYPLLLSEMIKYMDDSHQDKKNLIEALKFITEVAAEINESKRRQDLVNKYHRDSITEHSLAEKISKFNLKNVRKKSSRLGFRISSTFGLSTSTKDEKFDNESQKFRAIEKMIKIFVKDLNFFIHSGDELVRCGFSLSENIANYYLERKQQQEVDKHRTVHRIIVSEYWPEFKNTIETSVIKILEQLIIKFSGPNKLIGKRNDKLLDFDSCSKKLEAAKTNYKSCEQTKKQLNEQMITAKNNYEALNQQLIQDLPTFCHYSIMIFKDAIQYLLKSRQKFIGRVAIHYLELVDLPLLLGGFQSAASYPDIIQAFNIKQNLIVDEILKDISMVSPQIFTRTSNHQISTSATELFSRKHTIRSSGRKSLPAPDVKVKSINSKTEQSSSQKLYLQEKYPKNVLFISTQTHQPVDVLDLNISNGDLVAVIKKQDPLGCKQRWFVDNGQVQGFVSSNILVPFHHSPDIMSQPVQNEKTKLMNSNVNNLNQNQDVQSFASCHQYKLFDNNNNNNNNNLQHQHRYDLPPDEDIPPMYDNLSTDDKYSNTKPTSSTSTSPSVNFNLQEFDPYAPIIKAQEKEPQVDHRYEEIDDEPTVSDDDIYFAAYPFKGDGNNLLSLFLGQSVIVKHRQDLNGNKEWWYVKDRNSGKEGFVPASYLTKKQ